MAAMRHAGLLCALLVCACTGAESTAGKGTGGALVISSGGNPNATPVQPKPEVKPTPVEPPPPPPEPVKREEVKPKEPIKTVKVPEIHKETKPIVNKADIPIKKQEPKKEVAKETSKETLKPKINTTVTRRTNDLARIQKEMAERDARDRKYREDIARFNEQQRKIKDEINGIVSSVEKNLGKSMVAAPVGPGGEAYANYNGLVVEVYKRAVYATHPQSDEDVNAVICVSVARDGSVRSSQWVRRTGNSVLDKAVDRAMNSVRSLPAFPAEAKDSERSFNITIAFEAKRVSA
jgi:TonB family protein